MSDYADIRRELSIRRFAKYGPLADCDRELWLRQMDTVAAEAGLPNVYRTHPYRSQKPKAAA